MKLLWIERDSLFAYHEHNTWCDSCDVWVQKYGELHNTILEDEFYTQIDHQFLADEVNANNWKDTFVKTDDYFKQYDSLALSDDHWCRELTMVTTINQFSKT